MAEGSILFLTGGPSGGVGGIGQVNRDVVRVIEGHPDVTQFAHISRLQSSLSPTSGQVKVSIRPKRLLRYALELLRFVLVRQKIDVVVCGHINNAFISWFVSRVTGGRTVLILHGVESWRPMLRRLANWAASRFDLYVVVSRLTADRFYEWAQPQHQIDVIHNSIDLSRYTPGPKRPDLLSRYGLGGQRVIMTLGRLVAEDRGKGFHRVIDIMALLPLDVHYLVLGAGPAHCELRQRSSAIGCADRVIVGPHMRGGIPRSWGRCVRKHES